MVSLCSLSFTWKITNFSALVRDFNEVIQSPKLKGNGAGGPEFFVNIRPWGFNKFLGGDEDDAKISVHLWVDGVDSEEVTIKYRSSIVNASWELTNTIMGETVVSKNTKSTPFQNIISRRELLDGRDSLLPEDALTFLIELEIVNEISSVRKAACSEPQGARVSNGRIEDLSKDLLNLFRSGEHADRTFVVGGVRFAVHSPILVARCPVLFRMFSDGSNEVDVPKIKPEVFECLLQAIYTETMVDNIDERAEDILKAADMFCLNKLKHRAEMAIVSRIAIDNVARFLLLAFDHDAPVLKEVALKFLIENKSQVKGTSGWRDLFKNPEVMFELFANL